MLRAPFATAEGLTNNTSARNSQSAWSEVRDGLKNAVGGGMLAQLVQELLLCCQQGGVAPFAATPLATKAGKRAVANGGGGGGSGGSTARTAGAAAGVGGRARMWGGAEEARAAARCLDALCSFAPGTTVWRRLLPGTFSGLFRAIRGIEVGSGLSGGGVGGGAGSAGSALALGGGPSGSGSRAPADGVGDGGRGGGGSKSALAEACLGVLGKVLIMCAGVGGYEAASGAAAGGQRFGADDSRGSGVAGVGAGDETPNSDDTDNPLMALRRLAVSSNASIRTAEAQDPAARAATASPGDLDGRDASLPKTAPSASGTAAAAAAAAAAATVIAVDDPEWDARTSDRLRLLLPPLLAFCCLHPGWRVRRATADFAADLLRAGCSSGGGGDGGGERGADGPAAEGRSGGQSGLLRPLAALLVEALVGLLLDGMPQVGGANMVVVRVCVVSGRIDRLMKAWLWAASAFPCVDMFESGLGLDCLCSGRLHRLRLNHVPYGTANTAKPIRDREEVPTREPRSLCNRS